MSASAEPVAPWDLLFAPEVPRARAYLNTAAEGLPLAAAIAAAQRYFGDKSQGEPGRVPMWQAHLQARERAGRLCAVPVEQVALLSSTTEALNTIAQGIDWRPGDEVVFTSVEFPSNMFPWVQLAARGVRTRIAHPEDGLVRVDRILEQISDRTRLVTVSQVSYATGQQLQLAPLWERVRQTQALLCVDATQAAGRVSVRGDQADFLVASAFKWLNSIHGAALLTVSPRAIEQNVLGPAGWLSAESCYPPDRLERFHPRQDAIRFQAGMPNFDSVYALAAALEFHTADGVAARAEKMRSRVVRLRTALADLGLAVLTPPDAADQAGIVAFRCTQAEAAKQKLAELGINVHGDDGRLRAAVHWYTTDEHVDRYLQAVQECVVRGGLA